MAEEEAAEETKVIEPNYTLYINNIDEKIPKEELKKTLEAIFSQWGNVLGVYVSKALKLRGQAWVIFDSVQSAQTALDDLDGYPLHDKPVRIQFSDKASDVIAKAQGKFVERPKYDKKQRKAEVKAELAKKRKLAESTRAPSHRAAPAAQAVAGAPQIAPAPGPSWAPTIAPAAGPAMPAPYGMPQRPMGMPPIGMPPMGMPGMGMPPPGMEPQVLPHKVLFVQGLPEDVDQAVVNSLFAQFPGYKEVRMIAARPGIAFVEFEAEAQAAVALSMNGYTVQGTHTITVTYAKR